MKLIYRIVALLCVCLTPVFANVSFLVTDVGVSAESIGAGGVDSVSRSAYSVFSNPSLLDVKGNYEVSLFTTKLFGEVNYRNVAISKRFSKVSMAVGFMDARVGDIPVTTEGDSVFEIVDYYSASFSLYKYGVQYQMNNNLSVGMGLNYYSNKIYTTSGSGFNTDIGFTYIKDRLIVSSVLKNIFRHASLNYSNNGSETAPLNASVSMRYDYALFEPMAQLNLFEDKRPTMALGSRIHPPLFPFMDILVGYKSVHYLDSYKNHWTMGLGLDLLGVTFNYAYEKSDHIEYDHNSYFSVKIAI